MLKAIASLHGTRRQRLGGSGKSRSCRLHQYMDSGGTTCNSERPPIVPAVSNIRPSAACHFRSLFERLRAIFPSAALRTRRATDKAHLWGTEESSATSSSQERSNPFSSDHRLGAVQVKGCCFGCVGILKPFQQARMLTFERSNPSHHDTSCGREAAVHNGGAGMERSGFDPTSPEHSCALESHSPFEWHGASTSLLAPASPV
jgi:hypothetical protein